MAETIRIGSYNVENLFRRAKILNLSQPETIKEKLEKLAELQQLVGKSKYTPADKKRINTLLAELKGYVTVNEYNGKLSSAKGRDDWFGSIDPTYESFDNVTRKNTAAIIRKLNADVLCVVEADSRPVLKSFASDLLKKSSAFKSYPHAMLIDGNDQRGIDVGIYSRFPFGSILSHVDARLENKAVFSRDCLQIAVNFDRAKPITFLVNHLKSKGYGPPAANNARRKLQARYIAENILPKFDLVNDFVVVAGDFNDTPGSDPLSPLMAIPDLHDALELQFGAAADKRWSYHFRGALDQIDYLLMSTALRARFKAAGVERAGIFDIAKLSGGAEKGLETITKRTEAASDHGAIWADFDL